jgi:hypothetical protein
MYRRKLQNQIDKLRLPPLRQPVRTPVLLADSKGFNLQQQVKVNPESFIQFWCKSSATAENRWLTNMAAKISMKSFSLHM